MMTNVLTILLYLFICLYCPENNKAVGYFDDDCIIDTLYYNFIPNTEEGPLYECRLIRGNGKRFVFSIGVAFQSMEISDCKKGCIETYQWKAGSQGFEEYTIYKYKEEHDNWILQKIETIYNDDTKEIYKPKELMGIDGTSY